MNEDNKQVSSELQPRRPWPDPTPEMFEANGFMTIWDCIKHWDINVHDVYSGYCGATGNHVRAIMDALHERGFKIVPLEYEPTYDNPDGPTAA